MKLAIIGSREFNNYKLLCETLDKYKSRVSLVVSGGARGADSLGEQWAKENNIPTLIFYPDWEKFGKRAGFIRNEDIIKNCDGAILFWNGISSGTKNSLSLCKKFDKPYKIIQI